MTRIPRLSTRTTALTGAALLLVATAATGALAADAPASVQVTASNMPGSRQFFVEDLAGERLTALDLGTGAQGQPFQTRVKDDRFPGSGGFTASAEMTSLYRTANGVIEYGTKVPSGKLSIGYGPVPSAVSGLSQTALPRLSLSGVLPLCRDLPGLLPDTSPLQTPLDALTGLPVIGGLPGSLGSIGLSDAAKPLCDALGGVLGTTPVSVRAVDNVLLALDEKVLTPLLNLVDTQPLLFAGSTQSGPFTNPSFLGDGAADPARTSTKATDVVLLNANRNPALNLTGLVGPLVDGLPLFPAVPGGSGAVTQVQDVVAALQSATPTVVSTLGTGLAGLSGVDQTAVLTGLVGLPDPADVTRRLPVAKLVDAVLSGVTGTYRSFPVLKVDLAGAPAGRYTGTMTVTFLQR